MHLQRLKMLPKSNKLSRNIWRFAGRRRCRSAASKPIALKKALPLFISFLCLLLKPNGKSCNGLVFLKVDWKLTDWPVATVLKWQPIRNWRRKDIMIYSQPVTSAACGSSIIQLVYAARKIVYKQVSQLQRSEIDVFFHHNYPWGSWKSVQLAISIDELLHLYGKFSQGPGGVEGAD